MDWSIGVDLWSETLEEDFGVNRKPNLDKAS